MASISAELRVAGRTYPLRRCEYHLSQATDNRGRASARVRYEQVQLWLDVPRDSFLGAWGADNAKRCAADIVFFNADGGPSKRCIWPRPTASATGSTSARAASWKTP